MACFVARASAANMHKPATSAINDVAMELVMIGKCFLHKSPNVSIMNTDTWLMAIHKYPILVEPWAIIYCSKAIRNHGRP